MNIRKIFNIASFCNKKEDEIKPVINKNEEEIKPVVKKRNAIDIACYIVKYVEKDLKSKKDLNNAKLQYILYLLYGIYAGDHDDELFDDEFKLTMCNFMIDSVFERFKEFGSLQIRISSNDTSYDDIRLDDDIHLFISNNLDELLELPTSSLKEICQNTHPVIKARLLESEYISKQDIKMYFTDLNGNKKNYSKKRRAIDIAGYIVREYASKDPINRKENYYLNNPKLQRLLYILYGLYSIDHDDELFSDDIELWTYGPAITKVYKKFMMHSYMEIGICFYYVWIYDIYLEDSIKKFINEWVDLLIKYRWELLDEFCESTSAIVNARRLDRTYIPKQDIKNCFKDLANQIETSQI